MLHSGPIPAELTERLLRAERHINAVERRLWKETERGLWSGHQAMARAAEAWFRLHGQLDSLLPPERYLPREVLQERLEALERAAPGTPLEARLAEIHAAEAAILAEPYRNLPILPPDELRAGLARKHRYLDALHGLVEEVEEAIANRYLTLRVGDWVNVPGAGIGQLLERPGLTGWFFVPGIGLTAPNEAIKGHSLTSRHLEPLALGNDRPVGPPAYYWLLAANDRWQDVERMAERHWVTISDLHRGLSAVLDAAAKAWLIGRGLLLRKVMWSQANAQRHVPFLSDRAPPAIAEPLIEALQRSEALVLRSFKERGRRRPEWQEEITDILRLARSGLTTIEDALQAEVDLAEGQWVEVRFFGPGRIVRRDGQWLVVDLGHMGVLGGKLFEMPLQRVPPQTEQCDPPGDEHRRWLWYASHPQACRGRSLCPCCRLPGIAAGEPGAGPCLLCGWTHDFDDYDPARQSQSSPGLDLNLGRRRFNALGYADEPIDDPPGWAAAWLDPQVLALRRRLVAALDDLSRGEGEDPQRMEVVGGLWADYLAALANGAEQGQDSN